MEKGVFLTLDEYDKIRKNQIEVINILSLLEDRFEKDNNVSIAIKKNLEKLRENIEIMK